MEPDIDRLVSQGIEEVIKDFDLVPKTDLHQSEYRYRLLMVQMLEKLLEEQRSRLRVLEVGIGADRGMEPHQDTNDDDLEGFPEFGSRIEQAVYFIKREGRPLQLREIVMCFAEVHEEARERSTTFSQAFSSVLSQGLKRGTLRRYSLPRRKGGWYYPNSWADENGELKQEYRLLID